MMTGLKWAFCVGAIVILVALVLPQFVVREPPMPAPDRAPQSAVVEQAPTPELIRAAAPPASPFTVRGTLTLDAEVDAGDFAWNDEGVPDGPTSIVVDINAQRLYVYRGGIEIGRSSLIYGADEKPTPIGTFKVLQKKKDHISNLYDAPMPYMLRLTMDGIAIHASEVDYNYATHGCVGLPDEFAALLFAEASVGDPVLVTNDWMPQIYSVEGAPASPSTI